MAKYDCVILHNNIEGYSPVFDDDMVSTNNVRDEVEAVEQALRELRFNPYVMAIDCVDKEALVLLQKIAPKFVFNLCEGLRGNSEMEMYVAGLLELLGIPYTGSSPLTLGLALNKFKVKQLLRAGGIPTPKGWMINPLESIDLSVIPFPVIVKPSREDASLGINSDSVVYDGLGLQRQIDFIHSRYNQAALVEQYVIGRELNVAVIGHTDPQTLPISEIDFSGLPPEEPRIVSYKAKWDITSPLFIHTVPICPAKLAPRTVSRIRELALNVFREIGCRDYARIDMRLDEKNNPMVLEVNPNPDISPTAGLARAAGVAGLSYTELIGKIIACAVARAANEVKFAYAS
ncbi:MAG: ATP-grasp domain-containing protein [Acidobacteria bacterium]|nr:ATP-grasp domain-containing protein [Acidobacteriota bacterium]MBI3656607.1 ATP-grasp domain-containing protein [Acidobacteriota bacterium]